MGKIPSFISLYLETYRPYLRHLASTFGFVLFMILNNGNILTDGTDEGKYLQKKYNDL